MRIRTRLVLLLGLVIANSLIVAALAVFFHLQLAELNTARVEGLRSQAELQALVSHTYQLQVSSGQLQTDYRRWGRQYARSAEVLENLLQVSALSNTRATAELADKEDSIQVLWQNTRTAASDLQNEMTALGNQITSSTNGLMIEAAVDQDFYDANLSAEELITAGGISLDRGLQAFVDFFEGYIRALERRMLAIFGGAVVAFVLVITLMVWLFTRSIGKRVDAMSSGFEELAAGDYSQAIDLPGHDELVTVADHINGVLARFAEVIQKITSAATEAVSVRVDIDDATDQSTASTDEIARNIDEMSQQLGGLGGTISRSAATVHDVAASARALSAQIESQASAVAESSSAVEEMAVSIQNVSRVAREKQSAASQLTEVTGQGGAKVESTNAIVNQIAVDVMEMLQIISVINKIAARTNFLSMNAAIEAAHAGEYGRGFSVVADEIRKLSESTNENATRIKTLLNSIATRANQALEHSNDSRQAFDRITGVVTEFTRALQEIATTMEELAHGSTEILRANAELDEATQGIRDASAAIVTSSEDMSHGIDDARQASEMVVARMKQIDERARELNDALAKVAELNVQGGQQITDLNIAVRNLRVPRSVAEPVRETRMPRARPSEPNPVTTDTDEPTGVALATEATEAAEAVIQTKE